MSKDALRGHRYRDFGQHELLIQAERIRGLSPAWGKVSPHDHHLPSLPLTPERGILGQVAKRVARRNA